MGGIVLGESGWLIAVDVKNTQQGARLIPNRKHQFGLGGRGTGDVTFKGVHVVDQLNLSGACRGPHKRRARMG